MTKKHTQRGFSLIEILVALAILSVLALLAANAFDGSRSKAQAMLAMGKQVGDANIQLKTDTGCFVSNPVALFDQTVAGQAASNYCNRAFGSTWSRPYLGQYPVAATGGLQVDKISAGVTLTLERTTGSPRRYYVAFNNVPTDIVRQALVECNGTDASNGTAAADRCLAEGDLSSAETANFRIIYSTTR